MCCVSIAACSSEKAEIEKAKQDELVTRINKSHSLGDDLRVPGIDNYALMGTVSLKESIARAINERHTSIKIRNDAEAFADITDGLQPFLRPESSCLTRIIFIGLPLTDAMIEPLRGKKFIDLQIRKSRLHDLHALKGMTTLQDAQFSVNPLNSEAVRVIGTFTELENLCIDDTTIHDDDLKYLVSLKKLKALRLTGCVYLSKAAIQQLQAALPNCQVIYQTDMGVRTKQFLFMATILKNDGQIDQAITMLQKLLQDLKDPHYQDGGLLARIHKVLGDCFSLKHQTALARAEYSAAAAIPRGQPEAKEAGTD